MKEETKNRRLKVVFLVAIVVVIILPNLLMVLDVEPENKFLKPNEQKKMPAYRDSKDLKSFVQDYEAYYNENFGLRETIYSNYARLKYQVLGESAVPSHVVVGEDGWLFLGNDFGNLIDEYAGIQDPTNEELAEITHKIREARSWLSKRGIDFYIVMAPNKHSIYSEYLKIKKASNLNFSKRIIQHVKNQIGFNILDLTSALLHAKQQIKVFYKTDTHWNDNGAFVAYQEIIQLIQKRHEDISPITSDECQHLTETTYIHDLNKILRFRQRENDVKLLIKEPKSIELEKKLVIPKDYKYHESNYEKRFKNSMKSKKILIFRDSFSTALVKFFKETFNETVIIWHHKFDKQLIMKERPDIVLFEFVERDIDLLKDI